MNTTKLLFTTFLFLLTFSVFAQNPATLRGIVYLTEEDNSREALFLAHVIVQKAGTTEMLASTTTDIDGKFYISGIKPGTYDVRVTYIGEKDRVVVGVPLSSNEVRNLDITFPFSKTGEDENLVCPTCDIIVIYERPIVDPTNPTKITEFSGDELQKKGTRDPLEALANVGGITKKDVGESVNVNNDRETSNLQIVDGVVTQGSIPETDIENMQVITSGIPAEFGDATGAIILITTKDPASEFRMFAQMESSQWIDAFGGNRLDLSVSAPLLRTPIRDAKGEVIIDETTKLPKTRTLLGYRLSATYETELDDRASALGSFKLKDEVLERIKANPLVGNPEGAGRVLAADFLTKEDFEYTAVRPNARQSQLILNGKLEYKPTANLFLTAGAQLQFDWGREATMLNRLFNYEFNPQARSSYARGFLRLRQSVPSTIYRPSEEDEEQGKLQPVLQNLSYEVQADYVRSASRTEDPRYGNRFFEYGYVGKIDRSLLPVIGAVDSVAIRNSEDSIIGYDVRFGHAANFVQFDGFTADNNINPGLAAYNNLVDLSSIGSMEEMEIINGRFTGNRSNVYGLFNNVHANASGYAKNNFNQLRGTVKVNFDLLANRESENPIRHSIQLGAVYEQRIERSYNLSPFNLWTLADQSANEHLSFSADRSRPTGETFFDATTQRYYERFENLVRTDEEGNPTQMNAFGERLREQLGVGEREWVNVHSLRPDQLSLDLFEPTTLIQGRQSVLNYYGYDYLGNPLGTDVQFNDFFTETDAEGRKTRPIAPVKPIYLAGYLQDQFMYKDIIVRAGVRIDAYDANTKVLRDPYSIAGRYTAAEFENAQSGYSAAQNSEYQRPSGIGDDYVVYVNENSPDASVVGYRNGDVWYDAQGSPVNNPRELGSNFIPALQGFGSSFNDPQGEEYNPDLAFSDYRPNLIVMPRLSFSFPIIKEVSAFYANYDVLAQRPPAATLATPLTYFNFRENAANGYIANPNLKSQRVVNYEVGYEQALTKFSRIKFSMLYREQRDMIQIKQVFFAYPVQYTTFGNDDFSTSKSFMFEYELRPRRKGKEQQASNSRIRLNYTLAFGEGTGSSPTSSATIAATDLKYIFPLDFDQRHTISLNWDLRYKEGSQYKGPRIGKFDLFANTGMNFNLLAFSGSPYTRKLVPGGIGTSFGAGVTEGSINGARLPWSYRVDVRIDRDFNFGGKSKGEGLGETKKYSLNVYLRVQNLLNTQNILSVYPATGSPVDDGFLSQQNSPGLGLLDLYGDSFSTLYDLRMQNPFNISRPRRIFVGAVMSF